MLHFHFVEVSMKMERFLKVCERLKHKEEYELKQLNKLGGLNALISSLQNLGLLLCSC